MKTKMFWLLFWVQNFKYIIDIAKDNNHISSDDTGNEEHITEDEEDKIGRSTHLKGYIIQIVVVMMIVIATLLTLIIINIPHI